MSTKRMVLIGLFAAICFVGTYLHIPISLGGSNSMIHLGTTAIFIAAILIGKDAGLAAGIGCALFDGLDPMFTAWVVPTFIIKGLTGYVAGQIAFARNSEGNSIKQNILAFIIGGIVSLVGYFVANWLIFVGFHTAVLKMTTSLTTTAIAIAVTIPIAAAIKPIVNKSGVKLNG